MSRINGTERSISHGLFEGGGGSGGTKAKQARTAFGGTSNYRGQLTACRNSFTGDTPVLMADGTTKLIQDVRVGDEVVATDPETGRTASRKVTATIVGTGVKHLVRIGMDTDGDGDTTGEMIIATTAHPFWNAKTERWVDARDLEPGDELRTSAGKLVRVHSSSVFTTSITVFNLTVANIHTYYVFAGQHPVLVHNSNCPSVPFGPKMNFKPNAKHDKGVLGTHIGPHPTSGQEMLDQSFLLNSNSGRRAAYDKVNKEIVIFAPDNQNATYHGFVVTWGQLDQKVRTAFVGQGIFNDKGKLKAGWK